ncbi:hypothetical protein [Staphylococcus edaphicus]|uniref:Uncharacterized protein n=1 Tax=Staphylococcus edaphicus TaxID=1955013 RepID=A0A2C6U5B0_9STAP|nr:hypothetical protein [Staphylococcus edaphicus]PHK49042.1 hypothetical protein BTJ66_10485 [Staphylococcus edaphicus]UQW81369.1 hypothetical protein MNY58_12540 [Staphylococcus edaphicus]
MVFIYIILSAILLYYAIKYGIRDGLIDRDAHKEELIYLNKCASLFKEIGDVYSATNKEKKTDAYKLYDASLDVLLSEKASKEKYEAMLEFKKRIVYLTSES